MRRTPSHARGLTLFEVVFVLAVLTILGAITFLQIQPFISRVRLYTGVRQVNSDLQFVRSKSISQNRRFRVTFRAATSDYFVERQENGTWYRHALHSHSNEEVADATVALPAGVRIVTANSEGDVTFLPRGSVDAGITITLGMTTGEETRQVIVNLAGRVRIE
ncbi:MAG: hypothetical protein HOP18_21590 [Deltaproteobacteria bacterium]|nr:hypothetical protein [Deltaproteobacteria bacterium]